jgi:hypothetical protein
VGPNDRNQGAKWTACIPLSITVINTLLPDFGIDGRTILTFMLNKYGVIV